MSVLSWVFHPTRSFSALLALACLGVAGPVSAVPIDYEIQQGAESQFQFSFLHSATSSCCGAPPQYRNNGSKLFRVAGTIAADWDAGLGRADLLVDSVLSATVLDASVPGAAVGDVFQLVLKAESFREETPNGRAEGELLYDLFDPDDLVTPVASGTFFVFPEPSFPASANRVSATRFNAWANNWRNGTDPVPSGDFFAALGIDVVTVPAPSVGLLLGSGVLAAPLLRRRRGGGGRRLV